MKIAYEFFQKHLNNHLQKFNDSLRLFSRDQETEKECFINKFFECIIGEFNGKYTSTSDQFLSEAINKVYLDWWTISFNEWKSSKKDVEQLLRERTLCAEEEFSKIGQFTATSEKAPEKKPNKCQHILARGVRKGDYCGKTTAIGLLMCSSHSKGKVQLLQHVHPEPILESAEEGN